MKKIMYLAVGVVLCIATIVTGSYGLSERNIEIYIRALEMVEEMEESTFPGYQLSQFPVAFYDGDHDYVVTGSGEGYQIEKRKPVLDAFVGTAFWVDDHYEVLMPTVEKFNKMFDLLNTAQSASGEVMGENSFDEVNYGDEEHIATMYHEGFHAYQMTNYEEAIVEGTAYYVESTAYRMVHTEEEYNAYYIDAMDEYTKGSHKYYNMGMAKCRILDKLSEEWKENYDFSASLTDLLYQQMEP